MRLQCKRRRCTHNELSPPSNLEASYLKAPLAHPAPSSPTATSSSRLWTCLHTQKVRSLLALDKIHILVLSILQSLPFLPHPSFFHIKPQVLHRNLSPLSAALFVGATSDFICQSAHSAHLFENSRLSVLKNQTADLMDALNSHQVALSHL